jgi:hypothetical protein
VLDTSGSLRGAALEQLKADIQKLSDLLQASDRIRLITFNANAVDAFGLQPGGARLPLDRIRRRRHAVLQRPGAALMLVPIPIASTGLRIQRRPGQREFSGREPPGRGGRFSSTSMYVALVPVVALQPPLTGRRVAQASTTRCRTSTRSRPPCAARGALYLEAQDSHDISEGAGRVSHHIRAHRAAWRPGLARDRREHDQRRIHDVRARKGYEGG